MPVIPVVGPAPLAGSSDLAARLRSTFDASALAAADVILRDVSAVIRDVTGMVLEQITADTVVLDGHGRPVELLPDWPVQAVGSVSVTMYSGSGSPTTTALVEHVDYDWSRAGVLGALSWTTSAGAACDYGWGSRAVSTVPVWPKRPRCITVLYDHGPDDEMLGVLQSICLEAAARVMSNPDGTVKVQIGNYTEEHSKDAAGVSVLTDAEMLTLKSLRGVRAG